MCPWSRIEELLGQRSAEGLDHEIDSDEEAVDDEEDEETAAVSK